MTIVSYLKGDILVLEKVHSQLYKCYYSSTNCVKYLLKNKYIAI